VLSVISLNGERIGPTEGEFNSSVAPPYPQAAPARRRHDLSRAVHSERATGHSAAYTRAP
jgi:hypothetical protein